MIMTNCALMSTKQPPLQKGDYKVYQRQQMLAFGLTALASMDEAVCYVKLGELLASAQPETRYGAFRALRALNDRDPVVQGELLNGSFWLHRVAPNSPPLVHLSSTRRAEIVLFGEDTLLKPPFSFLAGEYVVTSGDGDERCTITRYRGRRVTRQCSQEVGDVLRTLAGMGGLYPEAVELLRQAHACQCLSCRVAVDALPQAVSVHELARTSRDAPELLRPDAEVIDARPDLGATPTLYQKTAHRPRADAETDEEAMLRDRKAKDERKSAERRPKPGE